MGNCLVTKLKGTVDNDNLPRLGMFRIDVNSETDIKFNLRGYIPSGETWYAHLPNGQEVQMTSLGVSTLPAGTYKAFIDHKYVTWMVGVGGTKEGYHIDLEELASLPALTELNFSQCDILVGNFDAFKGHQTLQTYRVNPANIGDGHIYGNLNTIVTMPALQTFQAGAGITGSIESLVKAYLAAGITTKSGLSFTSFGEWFMNVTFKGVSIQQGGQFAMAPDADDATLINVSLTRGETVNSAVYNTVTDAWTYNF